MLEPLQGPEGFRAKGPAIYLAQAEGLGGIATPSLDRAKGPAVYLVQATGLITGNIARRTVLMFVRLLVLRSLPRSGSR